LGRLSLSLFHHDDNENDGGRVDIRPALATAASSMGVVSGNRILLILLIVVVVCVAIHDTGTVKEASVSWEKTRLSLQKTKAPSDCADLTRRDETNEALPKRRKASTEKCRHSLRLIPPSSSSAATVDKKEVEMEFRKRRAGERNQGSSKD
jgi:hypothetical protein